MLDINIIKLFVQFCVTCASWNCLANMDNEERICLFEECLVMAIYCHDVLATTILFVMLGVAYFSSGKYRKAIEYHQKSLTIAQEIGDKDGEASSYGYIGNAYQLLGDYHKAIEYHEKRLGIAQEIGDKDGEAQGYAGLGNAYQTSGDYHKAIEYHEKSLSIAKEIGDKDGEGKSYGSLGNAYFSLSEYQKAIEFYEKSLSIDNEIGNRMKGESSYGNIGNAYHSLGKYHKAIEYHKKGLRIAQETENKVVEGNAHLNLGNAYQSLGEYQKAIESYKKGLSITKEIGNRGEEGSAYLNLGIAYHLFGKYHKAIEFYEKSLSIAKEIGDRRREGKACGNLGNAYESLGDYYKTIEFYEKNLNIAKEIGNKQGEESACGNLGNAYHSVGEYLIAIGYSEKSLSIAKEIGDRSGEAKSFSNLGDSYNSLGEYHRAIEYHEKSLLIAKEIGNKRGEGSSYGSLGVAYQSLRKYHKAIEYHEKRLNIAKEIGDRVGEGYGYHQLGTAYQLLGEYHKAIEYHEKSLSIAKETSDRRFESDVHHNIGVFYRCCFKNLTKAEESFKSSIECYEKLFDGLKEKDQFKISLVDTYVKSYKLLSQVQLETNQPEEALLACERGRARALRDLLSIKYSTAAPKQKSLDVNDIKRMAGDSCVLFYDLIQLNEIKTVRLWVIASLSSIFVYDEIAEREALAKITSYLSDDELINIEIGYFQHLLGSIHRNLSEGMTCEDRSLEALQCEELQRPSSTKVVSNLSESASNAVRKLSRLVYIEENVDDKPLEILFARLVSPVLDMLTQEEIVIIPDGPLSMVPFSALQDPKTSMFLSETKRLRLAPSLTTMNILQESSHDRHYKSGALIIGDPAVGTVMYRGKTRPDIYPLQGARDEAIAIGKLLRVQPLIGRQATKETILRKLQHGVSVIHFAAHGSAQKGEIFLAPSQPATADIIPEEKDYMLTMKEAQESGIGAQLVVLSCCHSGRGEIKSEGVVGMARAFLAAGARAVVASLWAVDDQATKLFMIKFYTHLKNGESASKSLQQAMKEMRETEEYKEPKYWAAFFLIGDDVTITV